MSTSTESRTGRLPREQRRRFILEAVTPLLMQKGARVTTAEMAEQAGVSEGTIFKVFADKAAVISAAVKAWIEPAPTREALENIDRSLELSAQLTRAGEILLERLDRAVGLAEVLRSMPESDEAPSDELRQFVIDSNLSVTAALTALLDRHADQLDIEPHRVAVAFRGLIFACGNPLAPEQERLTLDEAVSIVLQGVSPRQMAVR